MRLPALLITLALVTAPLGPLAASATEIPSRGSLPHGGSYVIYRDSTLASAAIDVWFRAPAAGYGNASPGIGRLAATAAAAATLESGKSLVALVRSLGGRMTINVYPDIIGVSAIVPSNAARRVIAAMSAAYFSPAIDDDALKVAQRDCAVLAVQQRYSSDDLAHNALFAQIFSGGPAHYAPLPNSISDLTRISLAEVVGFAHRAFRSGNATITIAGDVDPAAIDAVTAGSPGSPDAPIDSELVGAPNANLQVAANVDGLGIGWVGPPISDERAATAMDFIADYLFRDQTGVVAKGLDPIGSAYVSGQFITLHNPGVMLVTLSGDTNGGLRKRVLDAVAALERPLDPATFDAAREAFLYHLASDTQAPVEQADNLGWYAAEGNGAYAPSDLQSEYWKVARSLDPAFIASIAKLYLSHPVVVQLNAASSKEPAS